MKIGWQVSPGRFAVHILQILHILYILHISSAFGAFFLFGHILAKSSFHSCSKGLLIAFSLIAILVFASNPAGSLVWFLVTTKDVNRDSNLDPAIVLTNEIRISDTVLG